MLKAEGGTMEKRANINCSCELIFEYILYLTSQHLLTFEAFIYKKSSPFTVVYTG